MAKKLTREQAGKLREGYLAKREALLITKVDALGIKLFDMVYEQYLSQLEKAGGKLVMNNKNVNIVKGLDSIYKTFLNKYNAPVVKGWVDDLGGIIPLNEKYFNAITARPTAAASLKATRVVNKGLGLTMTGKPISGGFVDLFLRDDALIKKIKKQTVQALTQGKGFAQFRKELEQTIKGVPEKELSGGLQQYYRNYAYDTMSQVDRVASDEFAKELDMGWFFYTGGVITDSRPLCVFCNGKLVNAAEFSNLTVGTLKPKYRPGVEWKGGDVKWVPLKDLGRFSCRHRKDYVDNALVPRMQNRVLDINALKT
jgi:hypothetical protein